jgi:hypothetical protein
VYTYITKKALGMTWHESPQGFFFLSGGIDERDGEREPLKGM